MVLIRLAYVADLPVPADLVRAVLGQDGGKSSMAPRQGGAAPLIAVAPSPSPGRGRGSGRGGQSRTGEGAAY